MRSRLPGTAAVLVLLLATGGCEKQKAAPPAAPETSREGPARPRPVRRVVETAPASEPAAATAPAAEQPATAPAPATMTLMEFRSRLKPVTVKDSFETFARLSPRPALRVPQVATAPAVDGQLDDAYAQCTPVEFRLLDGRAGKPTQATTVHAVSTDSELFIFYTCHASDTARLRAGVTDRDGDVWQDDSVEMFIDPSNQRRPDGYMHLVINSLGTTAEFKGGRGRQDSRWNPSIRVKTRVDKTVWTVEIALPLAELVQDPKAVNRVWAMNFNRMAHTGEGPEDTAWCPTGSENSHDPEMFGCAWLDAGTVSPPDYAGWTGPQHVYVTPDKPVFKVEPADPRTVVKVGQVTPNADITWCFGPAVLSDNSQVLVVVGPERSVQISTPHSWRPFQAQWLNTKVLLIRRDLDEHQGYYCLYDVQRNRLLLEEFQSDGVREWERLSGGRKEP